jgi:hypothetical protein
MFRICETCSFHNATYKTYSEILCQQLVACIPAAKLLSIPQVSDLHAIETCHPVVINVYFFIQTHDICNGSNPQTFT